mgnify:FL=1
MTHVWRHPKYYAELRKLRKLQAAKVTSHKLQANKVASYKLQLQATEDSEDITRKLQAHSHKQQVT